MRRTAAHPLHAVRERGRSRVGELLEELGPGVVTGAADDDPSGIATYSQAGAQFGYGLLWTMLLTWPLMTAVQLVSAHIGRVTGAGLAKTFAACFPRPVVSALVAILLIANIFNIGADLSAMGAAAELVAGGGEHLFLVLFATLCVLLQLYVPYRTYAHVLKWLTLSLLAYVAVLAIVHVRWSSVLVGSIWPRTFGTAGLLTIVAVLGTTISPYLFFWQSSQEAEEIVLHPESGPLKIFPHQVRKIYRQMQFDTILGMFLSNFVAWAIMIAAGATLHARGLTDIQTAADAAGALRPIAGRFASVVFALGIIGTGLLAVPVLAGSAAFAVGEARGWKTGLEYKPADAARFYSIIVGAVVIGAVLNWSSLSPMKALFYSAVLNGIASGPIMAAMMIAASRRDVMGHLRERRGLLLFGWVATGLMALASAALLASLLT